MNPTLDTANPPQSNDTFRIEEDRGSGKLHKRYADEFGRFRLVDERCNRDKSGTYVVLTEVVAGRDESDFCGHDFPRDGEGTPLEDIGMDDPASPVDGEDVGA